MCKKQVLVLCVGLVLGAVHATSAQEAVPQPANAALAERIDELNFNLSEISRTLQRVLESQKLQVMLRRIELEERRVAPLSNELRGVREGKRHREEEIARLEAYKLEVENSVQEAIRGGADPADLPMREEVRHLEAMITVERSELDKNEMRVIELENDLLRRRDQIEILDEQLQELLDKKEK